MGDPVVEALESISTFRVDACCEGYPDVIFEIILDTIPSFRPIHYISDIDSLPESNHPRGIYIHIDLGNSSPWALLEAVRALERSELPIFRVALQ